MSINILIYLVELHQAKDKKNLSFEIHITDSEIIDEVESLVGKGVRCSIKNILDFIILSMINKDILNYSKSTLHICISGNSQNIEHKVKHYKKLYILQVTLAPLIAELHEIKTGFIDQNGYKWKIELYISAD
ncbi:11032_t:CDS:2 [Scutellospora calospora]|uniref:11032_t:CDS:1 n=1 Tax=Scutellospora calospora TaxID=85575 RepID=A0ACA9KM57_9GLOM|nr:11032_t:CDS:2 [Scutellospora calospora]